jgi:hypothetical protein
MFGDFVDARDLGTVSFEEIESLLYKSRENVWQKRLQVI